MPGAGSTVGPGASRPGGVMEKWNLIVDVALCQNCNNCVLAAKDELVGNTFPGYSAPHAPQGPGVLRMERSIRGSGHMTQPAHRPVMCNHCDDAPCLKAGGDAVRKRPDGIVIIDPEKARGRRDLVDACPYDVIVWNEAEQVPQNWFFDAHLLDQGWKTPRCVNVCPTGAIEAVKLSDQAMAARVQHEGLRPIRPDLGTRPRVHYRNAHYFDRMFVGGSIVAEVQGRRECIEGARVQLYRDGQFHGESSSDGFGDFKFDDLPMADADWRVMVSHPVHGQAVSHARGGLQSMCLGEISLIGGVS